MLRLINLVSVLFLLLMLNFSCKEKKTEQIKTEKISFTKEGELSIFKKDSLLVHLDIEIAESDYETQTGLMHRTSMKEKQAMFFVFDDVAMHNFHMKNTQIPLDIVFIDDKLRIASFQENAKPFDEGLLNSQVPVQYVLEINAGLAEKWLLEVGDRISYNKD